MHKPILNPLEKLDLILAYFVENKQIVKPQDVWQQLNAKYEVSGKEIEYIFEKLHNDGFLTILKEGHRLTFKGLYFEGYVIQKQRILMKESIEARNENRIVRNDILLVWGSWFAGTAGFLLLLWQIWIWFYPNFQIFSDFRK